jgi:hypothetical protein
LRKVLDDSFDKNFDFSDLPYENIAPNGPYTSGIDPKHIVEPNIRKDYEERLAKNTQRAYEFNIQSPLQYLLEETLKEVDKIVHVTYAREPRADQELIDILEKYEYPKEESIKLLCEMNIPYKGFRIWESTDKLFKTTAKFVSLEKDEVILEPTNGKQTSIELDVLRKEDQEYVRYRLALAEAKQPPVVRTWRSSDGGHEIKATFVSGDTKTIYLKREDGITIEVEVALLAAEDQEYVQLRLEAEKETKL